MTYEIQPLAFKPPRLDGLSDRLLMSPGPVAAGLRKALDQINVARS